MTFRGFQTHEESLAKQVKSNQEIQIENRELTSESGSMGYYSWKCDYAASPVGRNNWTIKLAAPFVAEAAVNKLNEIRDSLADSQRDLDATYEALRIRRESPWKAFKAWFTLYDVLVHNKIILERHIEEWEDDASELENWIVFLTAMPLSGQVTLNQNDFAYFFPGDAYANMTK